MTPALALSAESFVPVFFIGLFVVIFALAIWGGIRQSKKVRENLQRMAQQLGLTAQIPEKRGLFSNSTISVVGTYRRRQVRIFAYTTGSGKSRTAWCALTVAASVPSGFTMKISGENLLTKAGRIFGVDDVQTGDPAFDARFYVKTNRTDYLRAALIPEVRMRLMEAWNQHRAHGIFSAESAGIKYAETGLFSNTRVCSRFPSLLDLGCDLAEIAEASRE